MKKVQKNLLGLAGLLIVTAMTVVAAIMPSPGAVAANSSVTDTIVVRVISTTPNITITSPENGKTFVRPEQAIDYTYEHVESIVVTLEYTDPDGNTITRTIETVNPSDPNGSGSIPLNLADDYGYGDFVIKIVGTGTDGIKDEEIIKFSFYPVTGEASQDENTGKVTVDLDYDENNDDIDYIEVNVYDEDGNLVTPLSPIRVPSPEKTAELPFADYNLPDGKYTIVLTAIDKNGNVIHPPYTTTLDYKTQIIPVPNTGGLFTGLNISQSDYLITGLIIFFLIGIFGIVFIAKNRQDKKRR